MLRTVLFKRKLSFLKKKQKNL